MESLFDVLEQIFAKVPIYDFGCNISDEAVLTLKSLEAFAKAAA